MEKKKRGGISVIGLFFFSFLSVAKPFNEQYSEFAVNLFLNERPVTGFQNNVLYVCLTDVH